MNKKVLTLVICLFFICNNYGQKTGIIKYRGAINQKHKDSLLNKILSKNISTKQKKMTLDVFNNAKEVEFILIFKNNESYYYYNPSLEIEIENNYNPTKGIVSSMPYYTDNSLNEIIEINRHVGNISHKPIEWKITSKTKKIGKYLCYQAIAIEKSNNNRRGPIVDEKLIAWFAPKIPLNFGPKYYKGLPGLILEIQKKKFSLIATEINLSPSKEIKIKRPNLKKVITKEESENRYKEMMEDKKKN